MELELNLPKRSWLSLASAAVCLFLLIALGSVGRTVIPAGSQVLTWREWQVLKGQRQYHREYQDLLAAVEELRGLLDRSPDPVRAQLACESILRMDGLPALAYQRQLLNSASQAVRDWAVGAIEKEEARAALEQALRALEISETQP